MKLFVDFFPIFTFFLLFKLKGIYVATAMFIVASSLQMIYCYYRYKKVELIYSITFVLGLVLGGATLFFHDELFIKWKPTLVYWFLALFFALSSIYGRENFLKRTMGAQLNLDNSIWNRLNYLWVWFFLLMGSLNLFVMHYFDTNTWVDFKLFGLFGFTFIFIVAQSIYVHRCHKPEL